MPHARARVPPIANFETSQIVKNCKAVCSRFQNDNKAQRRYFGMRNIRQAKIHGCEIDMTGRRSRRRHGKISAAENVANFR
jgi:hypothetical protein